MVGQFSPIEVDFRARTTGTGIAHRPEIFIFVEPVEFRLREPNPVVPDFVRLFVFSKDGDHEILGLETDSFRQQGPGMLDRLLFEVIAKREIAEHFEERVMSRGSTHVFEIIVLAGDTHAFLRGRRTNVVASLLTEQGPLERHHARVHEHQGRIRLWQKRVARHTPMAPLLEEAKKNLADLPGRERHGTPRMRT